MGSFERRVKDDREEIDRLRRTARDYARLAEEFLSTANVMERQLERDLFQRSRDTRAIE